MPSQGLLPPSPATEPLISPTPIATDQPIRFLIAGYQARSHDQLALLDVLRPTLSVYRDPGPHGSMPRVSSQSHTLSAPIRREGHCPSSSLSLQGVRRRA